MKSENGKPVFCNDCPNRGTCVGELSEKIIPTETRNYSRVFYNSLRLQDKVHGRSADLEPLESGWFNDMRTQTEHLEKAGKILLDRVAACTGPNATGSCVIVDTLGISHAVREQLEPKQ